MVRAVQPRHPFNREIYNELADLNTPKPPSTVPVAVAPALAPPVAAPAILSVAPALAPVAPPISVVKALIPAPTKIETKIINEIPTKIANALALRHPAGTPTNQPMTAGQIKAEADKQIPGPRLAGNTSPAENMISTEDQDIADIQLAKSTETPLIFDIPVTYNERVSQWIRYFQTEGRGSFRTWLERSSRYLPLIQYELTKAGLPLDLSYVAMIESGFAAHASSHAGALGLWQFIPSTGVRYGLKGDYWIDERRDFYKSTRAAISYMSDLFKQFDSWYLVAASYNMGEGGVRRLIQRRHTNNFWELADLNALPQETRDYVPKIIAATLISKAPALYGFRDLNYQMPLSYESMNVPGGTDLVNLASFLGVSEKYLKDLNPELLKGFIPRNIRSHRIRIPKGSGLTVAQYIRQQARYESAN